MTAPTPEWSAAARAKACQETCPHWREQVAPCLACLTTLAEQAFAAGNAKHVEHHRCARCYAAGVAEERARLVRAACNRSGNECSASHVLDNGRVWGLCGAWHLIHGGIPEHEIAAALRDGVCHGASGGVRGNENVVDGIVVCDYCSVRMRSDGPRGGA